VLCKKRKSLKNIFVSGKVPVRLIESVNALHYLLLLACVILVLIPLIFLIAGKMIDQIALSAGKQHIKKLGWEYVRGRVSEDNYSVHFKVKGRKFISDYRYYPVRGVDWLGLPPEEEVRVQNEKSSYHSR